MNSISIPRILVVDDDESDFFIISDLIGSIPGQKFIIDWTYDYDHAVDRIKHSAYDLYFVDYFLGERTGLDLLQEAMDNHCVEPLVLLTGINDIEVDIRAMKVGAVDYLIKSELNVEKLERCIRYSLERSISLKALLANERKFHSIFEKSKDAVFLANEDLLFKEVNSATSELFKFSREELLQMTVYDLFLSATAATALKTELEQNGYVESMEIELVTKKTERKCFVLSVSRETDTDDKGYFQGIIRDITAVKRMKKATEQIEKLQSTARLLGTLAHEVRNPLTNISLSLDHLKSDITNSAGFIEIMDRNLKRINALVTELLNSSHPRITNTERIALPAILDRAIDAAGDRISLKQIMLQRTYPTSDPFIMADPEKLKIAFLNIIINAVEAMKDESGVLDISVSDEASRHKVLIRDNGTGISEANLPRIFEPHFTSKSNGFGLGLASTLSILQSHEAEVDVQSEAGVGTTFFISFNKVSPDGN